MIIRDAQLTALGEPILKKFENALFEELAPRHHVYKEEWLRQQISSSVQEAISFNIVLGGDIHRYVALKLNYFETIEALLQSDTVKLYLSDPKNSPASKVEYLDQASLSPSKE